LRKIKVGVKFKISWKLKEG